MHWWQFLIVLLLGHGSGLYAGRAYRPQLVAKVVTAIRAAEAADRAAVWGPDPEAGYSTQDVSRGLCGRLEPAGWHCHLPAPHTGQACLLTPHPQPKIASQKGTSP